MELQSALMITSPTNPKLKLVRRLLTERRFREEEQAYVIESTRWLMELPKWGVQPHFMLFTEAWQNVSAQAALLAQFHAPAYLVEEKILREVSGTEHSSGILAVVPIQPRPLPANPTLLLILDRITDPGNLGTILRTTAASGADGLILSPGCVDLYSPKVVRSSMGAHLRLSIHSLSWEQIGEVTRPLTVYLAEANAGTAYNQVNWQQPAAIIIGNEANGTGIEAQQLANQFIFIPMSSETESLNAAVSAGIILFEALRQRQSATPPA